MFKVNDYGIILCFVLTFVSVWEETMPPGAPSTVTILMRYSDFGSQSVREDNCFYMEANHVNR